MAASEENETKKQKQTEYQEKLKLLDQELMSFYQYCQQAGFSESEMDKICAPLVATIRKTYLQKILKVTCILLLFASSIYASTKVGIVNVHLTALSRILMIKIIPFWDWTPLFYQSCLVSNPFYGEFSLTEEDCVSCETLEGIDRLADVNYEHLLENYLQRDAPLIVSDAMESWPLMHTDDFWFENITQLYLQDEKLRDTVPCIMTTNIRTGSSDLHAFLKKIHNPKVDRQNCDLNAVKALRKFYQRPYFLANSVAPAHFNWVDIDSGLIMLSQLRGSTSFRLLPHSPCNSSCSVLEGDLVEGEILVFANFMWNFEYIPGKDMDNVAILTETVWENNAA
ncbi:hypothetical protein J437_LFUL000870 [Ladona fulva]|uniref:Uncharacterized protein n=1 Tax=Ladona fulva TaxID=123851 RepID=A0A8K0JSZ0_LADFU|nr:hypothetical protein J437_LFUL000870 [Ladona fulva]